MIPAKVPKNETERLEALRSYEILDTGAEQAFDDLTFLASHIFGTPISLVSLIDKDRQWFKSRVGLDSQETKRDIAFCAHAVESKKILIVPDTQNDIRFHDNPLVTQDPNIRFYAGAPLITPDGFALGTLCVIDRSPRDINEEQADMLLRLANQVVDQFELRKQIIESKKNQSTIEEALDMRNAILDSADFSIISTTTDGTIMSFNKSAERLLGYTSGEIVGKTTPSLFHDLNEVENRARELTKELGREIKPGFETFIAKSVLGIADEREWTYIRKDKSRFPVRLSVTPIRKTDGHITGFLGIGQDITIRKELEMERDKMSEAIRRVNKLLESELEETSMFYKHLVEGSSEIIFSMDSGGLILSMNQRVEDILGYEPGYLVGKNLTDILFADPGQQGDLSREILIDRLQELGRSSDRDEMILPFRTRAGSLVELKVTLEFVLLGKPVIFGRAAGLIVDSLGKYCISETQILSIGSNISLVDLISRRFTSTVANFLTEDDVSGIRLGLGEMLMNSIEHGNLGISFEEKTIATEKGNLLELIRGRMQEPGFRDRRIKLKYSFDAGKLEIHITDEGEGFDFKAMMERDVGDDSEFQRLHGRGILMTQAMFDRIEYSGNGNSVTLIKYFPVK